MKWLIYTVWRVIFGGANFCGKSEKALRINFSGFKLNFRDSSPVRGCGAAQNDDVINTRSRSRSISFVTKPLLQRNLDKQHEIEQYCDKHAISWMTVAIVAY
jgi:hypothetical protein